MNGRLRPDDGADGDASPFAHASEAEFARILDFYEVGWRYEPDVFPILWDLDGNVVESFAPDFYLPEMDLYVELTTLQQRLVRKKNRKVRRLRELYPSISIKLFYARDFRALMLKYGRVRLIDELTGTVGQVGSRHGRPDDASSNSIVERSEPSVVPAAGPSDDTLDLQAEPSTAHTLISAVPVAEPSWPALGHVIPIGRSRAARRRAARRNHAQPSPLEH